ncbi:gamma-glutamyl-gamma-aminobutyrate hydrolase family protein [Enterococcus rivorum]|uniref:Gamma-glutamyl-gamma-aminobutyrate hydrolase n=1 Tax=Enterococcus rivorum TaxID=762845 RepID=A0A1E5L1G5_9ENTE|nr:gamma-glutamyl-gamma-aminobutyrate hydrolase family protein [Enterococcus rivorum]MBP2098765.1 putative glutamine amidotransferase [Enterococcus rivorum]OEH83956.1 gamma-glutamyl-gamma-aminobutyrate hydrolase [Enterococcus rivorum]
MGRPVMGIAANEIMDAGKTLYHLPISYTPAGYVKAVNNAGGLPLILPIGSPDTAKDYINQIDKLILAGGQNVAPEWYGESVQCEESALAKERDIFEMALIKEALKQKKPIFAICRGMQIVNVAFGGSLHQDIRHIADDNIQHMQAPIAKEIPTHKIRTTDTSVLRKIYGKETKVNSFHWQAVKKLAPSLKATAYSEDGIIEGVESKFKNVNFLGVQWHPDFAYDHLEQEMNIFRYVVKNL